MALRDVRYADSNGVAIAYAVYGSGPVDVVMFPGMLGHLELNEEIPYYRPILERVPEFGRLVMFDRRGAGLSDRSRFGTTEERMDDLRAVMDAVGLPRAAVLASADGAPLAALFAATYPDRVTSLVLHETAPAGETLGITITEEAIEALSTAWGTGLFMGSIFQGGLPNPDNQATAARWERNIAWPQQFRKIMTHAARTDVRHARPLIAAPTLLVHNTGDPIWSVEEARLTAASIPGAHLVELPIDCNCTWDGSSIHAASDVIEPFLSGHAGTPQRAERLLATVLFTDIVDSTRHARERGDQTWSRLLDRVEQATQHVVAEHAGRLVKSTGDGALCVFDGPGRAVSAALAIRQHAASLGLSLRAGLHAGEVELRGADIGGVAVHLAARIEQTADPGEVLVSRTVVDLTYGSDIKFEPWGRAALKGFDQEWELHRVIG